LKSSRTSTISNKHNIEISTTKPTFERRSVIFLCSCSTEADNLEDIWKFWINPMGLRVLFIMQRAIFGKSWVLHDEKLEKISKTCEIKLILRKRRIV